MDNGDNQHPIHPIEGLSKFIIQRKCISRKSFLFPLAVVEKYTRQKMEMMEKLYNMVSVIATGIESKQNEVAALEGEKEELVEYIAAIDKIIDFETNRPRMMR